MNAGTVEFLLDIDPCYANSVPLHAYRFGFNGKEADTEWHTDVNYDYGARIYDPRISRFLSVDPLTASYPWYTPYQFAGNMPIWAIDLDGLEEHETNSGTVNGPYANQNEAEIAGIESNPDYPLNVTIEGDFKPFPARVPENTQSSTQVATHGLIAGTLALSDGPQPGPMDIIAGIYLTAVAFDILVGETQSNLNISIDAPFDIPIEYVSDDAVTTIEDPDGYIVVFRGVHPDHPDYANALIGVATPRGGHSDSFVHNKGNNASVYTSWTVSPFQANHFATKQGRVSGGIVLIKKVHVSEITRSPDIYHQGEVLLKGIVTGAIPVPAVKY